MMQTEVRLHNVKDVSGRERGFESSVEPIKKREQLQVFG